MSTDGHRSDHTCVVQSVTARVAGRVMTDVFAHHFGTPEQQVGVRTGDVLTYVHDHDIARDIAQVFTRAQYFAAIHLRERVAPSWLGIEPDTYPPSLLLRFALAPVVRADPVAQRTAGTTITPAHVAIRVGPVLWQVCDQQAAVALADAWTSCTRMLT